MPEDLKPELTIEAAMSVAIQTEPLRIPSGCSVAVELMVAGNGAFVSAPSAEPPGAAVSATGSSAGASRPTEEPPGATIDRG